MTSKAPTRLLERSLLRSGHRLVGGVDEVGRGALAGPVSVGVVVVDMATRTAPQGLRDSKLLAPAARQALQDPIRRWCVDHAVGHAGAGEIDEAGIMAALRVAALRALRALHERGTWPEAVILDGSYNWLRAPEQGDLFAAAEGSPVADLENVPTPAVQLKVKADMQCSAVAAASVLAKYERDTRMVELDAEHPGYGWAMNKGYAAPEHIEALRVLGPSPQHRVSWRLPGAAREGALAPGMMGP
jgi:ribonuclease HII